MIRADGWVQVEGTKHLAFEHPTKAGKVNVGANWTNVRPGSDMFKSVCSQAGLTRTQFEDLYWGL